MPGGMQKARKYDIGETNIAGLGTPLEKAIREASAGHEDAVSTAVGPKAWGLRVSLIALPIHTAESSV